ncbi:MAG: putative molybdenum carrier protein [Verrucomicrobiota bacterium]
MNKIIIISGGQTGADRAALDWAIAHDVPHGGWCPKGRRAEDGPLAAQYQLQETPTANYLQRTEWNIRDSDATVIFSIAPKLTGGSLKTAALAAKHKKLMLHLAFYNGAPNAELLRNFVTRNRVSRLNVAGPRASKEPEVAAFVRVVLYETFDSMTGKPVFPTEIR